MCPAGQAHLPPTMVCPEGHTSAFPRWHILSAPNTYPLEQPAVGSGTGGGAVIAAVLRLHLPLRGLNTSPSKQAATHLPLALIFSFAGHAHTPMVVRPMLGGQAGSESQV